MADSNDSKSAGGLRQVGFRFHGDRDRLLAESYARPSTALPSPTLASRIATFSGESGAASDRAHMQALCRRLDAPEPSPGSNWCLLEAGGWRLRWERHTELSTWTFYRPFAEGQTPPMNATALDQVPLDWLDAMPGPVLAAAHLWLLRARPSDPIFAPEEEIAARVVDGAIDVFTDFRPGSDSFSRFVMVQPEPDAALAGRTALKLFEIETYRLLALLAFPMAKEAARTLSALEDEAAEAAQEVALQGGIEADRALLNRLAALAGRAQSLAGRTGYRFAAARAYQGIVNERIQQLREQRLEGRPTIAEFMERRLAPAMRTCAAVAERQQAVIQHIARTSQLLNTRVEVAAEATNASLLASMDRRATMQLRLQQAVEAFSVAAISYYSVGLLNYGLKGLEKLWPAVNAALLTGLSAPVVIAAVWIALRRARKRLFGAEEAGE